MASKLLVQAASSSTNRLDSFANIDNIYRLEITRTAGCVPSTLIFYTTYEKSVDSPPAGTPRRFYQNQFVRVCFVDSAATAPLGTDIQYFIGRIDQVDVIQDSSYGRVIKITARDVLATLADNYIDIGRWRNTPSIRGLGSTYNSNKKYKANYVGQWVDPGTTAYNYQATYPGEYRRYIIGDLALNIIGPSPTQPSYSSAYPPYGPTTYSYTDAPNSKKVEYDFSNTINQNILDVIRNIASSDPWWTGGPAEVDAKTLSDNNFPTNSGIGGEFQAYNPVRLYSYGGVIYYRRGATYSGITLSHGNPRGVTGDAIKNIIEYDTQHDGLGIYSRIRPAGAGEAVYERENGTNSDGAAAILDDMETFWNPLAGLFRMRREIPYKLESIVGEWQREDRPLEKEAIKSRALRDHGISQLVSGGSTLTTTGGGITRGWCRFVGRPEREANAYTIMPSHTVLLEIPELGFIVGQGSDNYVIVESWTYEWPANITTLNFSRKNLADSSTKLLETIFKSEDMQAALKKTWTSGWFNLNSNTSISMRHGLGVNPKVQVKAAYWNMSDLDPDGNPLPSIGTEIDVPPSGYDPSSGSAYGFAVSTSTDQDLVVQFNYLLGYTSALHTWYKRDDQAVLIRIIATV